MTCVECNVKPSIYKSKNLCKSCYARLWRKKHKVHLRNYDKKYRSQPHVIDKVYGKTLKSNYGISIEVYEDLYKQQNGKCAICNIKGTKRRSTKVRLIVDHNHKTGKIRQLLCGKCNTGLGHLQDSPGILKSALRYLRKHGYYGPD